MKSSKKEIVSAVAGCLIAVLIPLLLIAYGFQAKRYADLSREITACFPVLTELKK